MNAIPRSATPLWRASLLAAVLCGTAACGLKGPLYLPDAKPDMVEVKVPPGVPTPSSQKKERSSDGGKQSDVPARTPTPPEQ